MSRRERSPQKKRNTENAENTEGHREEREEYVWKEQKKMPKEHFTFQPSLFLRSPYLKSSSVFLRVLCVLCVRLSPKPPQNKEYPSSRDLLPRVRFAKFTDIS
jgi:hypothetical protein